MAKSLFLKFKQKECFEWQLKQQKAILIEYWWTFESKTKTFQRHCMSKKGKNCVLFCSYIKAGAPRVILCTLLVLWEYLCAIIIINCQQSLKERGESLQKKVCCLPSFYGFYERIQTIFLAMLKWYNFGLCKHTYKVLNALKCKCFYFDFLEHQRIDYLP